MKSLIFCIVSPSEANATLRCEQRYHKTKHYHRKHKTQQWNEKHQALRVTLKCFVWEILLARPEASVLVYTDTNAYSDVKDASSHGKSVRRCTGFNTPEFRSC
ncbi:hypothetical protein IFVP182_C170071 [Vibrio parahaemolyticus]